MKSNCLKSRLKRRERSARIFCATLWGMQHLSWRSPINYRLGDAPYQNYMIFLHTWKNKETMWLSMELNQDILVRSISLRTIDRTTSRWSPIASKVGLKDARESLASFALPSLWSMQHLFSRSPINSPQGNQIVLKLFRNTEIRKIDPSLSKSEC